MSEIKNAVIVGKITLAPRKEVVVQKPSRQPRQEQAPRQERPKQMKRSDDGRAAQAGNQAMLQELQYVKRQLRTAQDNLSAVSTGQALFVADVKALLTTLSPETQASEEYQRVAKALGL